MRYNPNDKNFQNILTNMSENCNDPSNLDPKQIAQMQEMMINTKMKSNKKLVPTFAVKP